MQIKLKKYQAEFLDSPARFPCMIAGIGTGKTLMLLLKVWKFCEDYPNSLALIARSQFTDLRDSTIKDFERYFNVVIDSNKEYAFSNGSKIMFRHAAELNVLKNINLSIAAIEQAEEFEDDTQFTFLRDRLRRDNAPLQQLCIVANANGHNWIWRKWINNRQEGYDLTIANTFENADNLPETFLKDLEIMKIDAPHHYRQFVENSFEEMDADDLLMNSRIIYQASKINFPYFGALGRILAVDIARFGDDETVACCIEKVSDIHFIQIHQEGWRGKPLTETVGKTFELKKLLRADMIVVDDVGLGGGVTDMLREQFRNSNFTIQAFQGNMVSSNLAYENARSEAFFNLKDMFDRGHLKIIDDFELAEQLMSLKYKFMRNGKKVFISKDEMRKDGLKSPDRADALAMACYYKDSVKRQNPDLSPTQSGVLEFVNTKYDPLKI